MTIVAIVSVALAIGANTGSADPVERRHVFDCRCHAVTILRHGGRPEFRRRRAAWSGASDPRPRLGTDGSSVELSHDHRATATGQEVFENLISPGWFATFGTPMRIGRDFAEEDRRGTRGVAIVNETFARRFLGNAALGQTLTVYPRSLRAMAMDIVGVAADAVYGSPRDPVPPTWYAPLAQFGLSGLSFRSVRLSVRAESGPPVLLSTTIAGAAASVSPAIAMTFRPLSDQIDAALTRERLMAQLAGFFGVLALLLAALGLYGVTAYAVTRRRAEVGIRLALGAPPTRVVRLVLARVWVLISLGVGIGAGLAYWGSTFVTGLLHGVTPRDASTMAAAVIVLLVMGLLAGWLPARRAARIDPAQVLRDT